MAKRTVYYFLKKKYPKHLVLFAKNNKIINMKMIIIYIRSIIIYLILL